VHLGGMRQVAVVGYMIVLAGLDFGGTMLAKEWTTHRAPWQLLAGAAAFLLLFAVLVSGLRFAEMSILTLGWIVMLQTAVLLVDRSRYGTTLTAGGWAAMLATLVLQGYLLTAARAES
jgi:hypothetical protein